MDRPRLRNIDVDQFSWISDRVAGGGNYGCPLDGNDARQRDRRGYCRGGSRLSDDPSPSVKAANVIHDMPDVVGTDAGFAVQAFHRGAEAVADIDENLAVCGSMIPLLVC